MKLWEILKSIDETDVIDPIVYSPTIGEYRISHLVMTREVLGAHWEVKKYPVEDFHHTLDKYKRALMICREQRNAGFIRPDEDIYIHKSDKEIDDILSDKETE